MGKSAIDHPQTRKPTMRTRRTRTKLDKNTGDLNIAKHTNFDEFHTLKIQHRRKPTTKTGIENYLGFPKFSPLNS